MSRPVRRYLPPEPLNQTHDLAGFASRSPEQTRWLTSYARSAHAAGTVRVFVVTEPDDPTVVAYYGWRMGQLTLAEVPARWRPGVGRYPQPVAVLARLAVDIRHEGNGLGAGLLIDVMARFLDLAEAIGVRGLLIHCETQEARDFYLHLIPELDDITLTTEASHPTLVLLVKDLRKTLRTMT